MKWSFTKATCVLLIGLMFSQVLLSTAGQLSLSINSNERSVDAFGGSQQQSGGFYPDLYFSAIKSAIDSDPNNNEYQPTLEAMYMALRSLAILGRISDLNAAYPNYALTGIMSRFNESIGLFEEPMNAYSVSDSNFKLIGCGLPLTNAYAVLALSELNQISVLSTTHRQSILNFLLNSQNPDGSFGGTIQASRAADTFFILSAIICLNASALSEEKANATKTWIKNRQNLNTMFGTHGGFPHPIQSNAEHAYMYETAFTLRIASLLNFSDYNLPYLLYYFNQLYEVGTGFVYNTKPLLAPNQRENALNLIHTTSALFYLSISEQNISGGYNSELFISYLLNRIQQTGTWLTGVEGAAYLPMHSLETYWLALEMLSKYNRISTLSNPIVQRLYYNIMNFSRIESSRLSFAMLDRAEPSFSQYLIRQIYRASLEIIGDAEKESIYQLIKCHYNSELNSFLELRVAGHFNEMKYNSYFIPFELRGFKLDSISGYVFHPRTTYLAVKLLDILGLLDRFIGESNLANFVTMVYAESLVNINISSGISGGFFIFSWNGYRLPYDECREWIGPDITYYHLKTIALLAKNRNRSITEIFSSDTIDLISSYIRTAFLTLPQPEFIRSAKIWESLTILQSATYSERQLIRNFVQNVLLSPQDKDLFMIAAANDLLPHYQSQITLPTQLYALQNRIQQILLPLVTGTPSVDDVYLLTRVLEITLFQPVYEIPDLLVIGRYFDALLRIESIALKNALMRGVSTALMIDSISYPMSFNNQMGYRVSAPIYQNFSSNRVAVVMAGSIRQDIPINISKVVQVTANFVISVQPPSNDQNSSGWIRENGKLKGTFLINSSYRNYADQLIPFGGFTDSFEAFDMQGNPIDGLVIRRTVQMDSAAVLTTINVEIPFANENGNNNNNNDNIRIKLRLSSPFLINSSIQKPASLNLAENGDALVYESTVNVSEVIRNNDEPTGLLMPELPWNVVAGMGASAGIVFTILKVKSNPGKKRVIDPEPSLL